MSNYLKGHLREWKQKKLHDTFQRPMEGQEENGCLFLSPLFCTFNDLSFYLVSAGKISCSSLCNSAAHQRLYLYEWIWHEGNNNLKRKDVLFQSDELVLRTTFPPHCVQQRYSMSLEALQDELDVIVGEIYVEDIRNLDHVNPPM